MPVGRDVYVFPWVCTRRLDALTVALLANNFEVAADSHQLEKGGCSPQGLLDALQSMLTGPTHAPEELNVERSGSLFDVGKKGGRVQNADVNIANSTKSIT